MTPRITAVITTYNRAGLLTRAIESVLTQQVPPLELVVVDDGSTDNTASVVERYASQVRYVSQLNAGLAEARNTGVRHAKGDWVAFLDDDDIWKNDYLSRIGAAIDRTAGAAYLYFADLERARSAKTLWEASGFSICDPFEVRVDASDWFMLPLQPMAIQSTVIRKDAYWDVGGQVTLTREDTYQFFLLGLAGPACAVAGVGAVLSDDAATGSRLTAINNAKTRRYCDDTVWMYRQVLRRHPSLRRDHRRELRRRVSAAYWQIGQLDLEERRLAASVLALGGSILSAPGQSAARLTRVATRIVASHDRTGVTNITQS